MVDWQANAQVFGAVVVLGGGLTLALVSLVAWRRLASVKAMLVGLGFLGLAAQGGFVLNEAWQRPQQGWLVPVILLDLAVLIAFYVAMRRR